MDEVIPLCMVKTQNIGQSAASLKFIYFLEKSIAKNTLKKNTFKKKYMNMEKVQRLDGYGSFY